MSKKAQKKIVESMRAAASALGVDYRLVQRAKRMACPAFLQGNRIDVDALEAWISANAERLKSEPLDLRDQKIAEEIRKLKIANDERAGVLVRKDDVIAAISKFLLAGRRILKAKLENEYPSAVAGLDVPQAIIYGKRLHDAIADEFRKLHTIWDEIGLGS
jgi:hypothetical protein